MRVPAALQNYTDGRSAVMAAGATLAEVFADLDRQFPGLRFRVVDEQGQLRPHMRLFVGGADRRALAYRLGDADEVVIVLALSGG